MPTKRRIPDTLNYAAVSEAMAELLTYELHASVLVRAKAILEAKYVPLKPGRPISYAAGTRIGAKVILGEAGRNDRGQRLVHVRCDCGNEYAQMAAQLRHGYRCKQCAVKGRGHLRPPVEITLPGGEAS